MYGFAFYLSYPQSLWGQGEASLCKSKEEGLLYEDSGGTTPHIKMLPNSKILQFLHSPPPALPPLPQAPNNIPTSPSPPILKQQCKFSRRDFTICSNSSLLLLLGSALVESRARAEEGSAVDADKTDGLQENAPPNCTAKAPTKRAFLDISIDGEPAGRIVIGLYGDDAPAGAARFSGLVSGAAGISYRRKEFVKIMPNYVQHGGVRSYGVDAELAKRTGSNLAAESLVTEWEKMNEKCPGTKNLAGSVGIVVRDPTKPPPKIKLVARGGKLEIDEEDVGADPNGTEFVITSKDSPELDTSTLVIGRVLEGMEVVEKIGQVKTVQENTGSPYFR